MNHQKTQGPAIQFVPGCDDSARQLGAMPQSIAPSSELQACIISLEDRLNTLDVKLSLLTERLSPVLAPENINGASEGKSQGRESLSPVGEKLRSMGDYTGHLAERVEYLLSRLAV